MATVGLWYILLTCLMIFILWKRGAWQCFRAFPEVDRKRRSLRGPKAWPIIGSLHLLGDPAGPFEAFTKLAKEYGDIYEIQLGQSKCVVVSSYSLLREVLITRGNDFGGRPDFLRFHTLFGGDRNNSLALCDWSDVQRTRRSLARSFCSPRGGSFQQEELSRIAALEVSDLLSTLNQPESEGVLRGEKPLKPLVLQSLGNMFTRYMCSTRFDSKDEEFRKIVRSFDDIFWDINQGYALDFLPWLKPFYGGVLRRLGGYATDVRTFILKRIIEHRRASLDMENRIPRDFTDALLLHLESPESGLSWDHILFELEDFLGGHSAIGNLVMMILAQATVHPDVQTKIQDECDGILGKDRCSEKLVSLDDRQNMPYTDAVIWETLRVSSSPIVPHVATVDTHIAGYPVSKDTVIFINNFELNLGEDYWGADSRQFKPERFIKVVDGKERVAKPDYFVPFSTGKRTCVGQKLVQGFAFVIVTAILSRFHVSAVDDVRSQLRPGCVAVPPDAFHFALKPRQP